MDSWRATTDCGTTCFSTGACTGAGSLAMMRSSGVISLPEAISRSRRSTFAESEMTASSASSWMRDVSRAAVFARIVATPSSRFSTSARSASVTVRSVFALARSSRISSATTWNFTRFCGPTLPRSAAASISRTARASTGMSPASSPWRARRWGCWDLPGDFFADGTRWDVLGWLDRAIILLS